MKDHKRPVEIQRRQQSNCNKTSAQARRRPDRDVDFNSEDDEDEETNGEPGDEPALDDLLADAEFGALSLESKA